MGEQMILVIRNYNSNPAILFSGICKDKTLSEVEAYVKMMLPNTLQLGDVILVGSVSQKREVNALFQDSQQWLGSTAVVGKVS
jgi:hypothetical protein